MHRALITIRVARSLFLGCGLVLAIVSPRAPVVAQNEEYRSPYRVEFGHPLSELIGDLEHTGRGEARFEAEVPERDWYSHRTRERWGAWGPPARDYPVEPAMDRWPIERKRERVIAVALRYQGYAYQHHHIPDWSPPAGWPWKETCAGANGRGVDCSNLTGFVYNQGFGLRISTDVRRQAEQRYARVAGRGEVPIERIDLPDSYAERLKVLKTGDLVFIRNVRGVLSHVVIWVGPLGRSPDGQPLVIDSHGGGVSDSQGKTIPCGVQLRPFREQSWYNRSASHALRLLPGP